MYKITPNQIDAATNLMNFIANSPSTFHAVANMATTLDKAGYTRLLEGDQWVIEPGGKYYVVRGGSAIVAFQAPSTGKPRGFSIMASHSDSPTFKLKPNPELPVAGVYTSINVESYGGALLSTWFDRPLSIAGRLLVREGNNIATHLVNVDRDLVMIPSLAIHMDREANRGHAYNIQKDLLPLYGITDQDAGIMTCIADAAGVEEEAILGHDLFLVNRQAPCIWGAHKEFISSPRLDDLTCAHASLMGFLQAGESRAHAAGTTVSQDPADTMPVHVVFDNEEVGSSTKQGAASTFLKDTLMRVNNALGGNDASYRRAVASSFMISADNAHALHPNYVEKADPINRPVLDGGIVIKHSANQKYTTDGVAAALCQMLCERASIPTQQFTNRSDMPGGSTLGNISGNQIALNTVDVGIAQLAMHSSYECCGIRDISRLIELAKTLYTSSLVETGLGKYRMK